MNTIVDCGIDWLTFTLRRDSHEYADWRSRCIDYQQYAISAGNIPKTSRRLGYEGISTGSTFVGEREDGGVIIISGGAAHPAFRYCWAEGIHVARLDVQVTVTGFTTGQEPGIAAELEAHNANPPKGEVGHRNIHIHSDRGGGYTLYVGSRSSPYFGRFYNKYAEAPEEYPDGTWRYEVQNHNAVATALAQRLQATEGTIQGEIASSVWQWWSERGVTPHYDRPEAQFTIPRPQYARADLERKLEWIKVQVRPTVELLQKHIDRDILYSALGIVPEAGRVDRPIAGQNAQED